MRRGTTAATAGSDDVESEAGLDAADGMSAAVVRREQLHVLVAFAPINLVLDPVVGEMHLAVEERQVVFVRPLADLLFVAVRSSVAVGAVAVVLLQELLVLALQVLLEDDAPDVEAAVLVLEACLLLAVRRVKVRVVVDFAGPANAGVERLRGLVVALEGVGIEQVTALLREDYTALIAAEIDSLDEPLGAEVAKGVVVDVEVLFGHDAEGAHRGKCSAVLANCRTSSRSVSTASTYLAIAQSPLPSGILRVNPTWRSITFKL